MFEVLLESGSRPRLIPRLGGMASIVVHGALVGGFALASAMGGTDRPATAKEPSTLARYMFPPPRKPSRPVEEGIKWIPQGAGSSAVEGVIAPPTDDALIESGGRGLGRAKQDRGGKDANAESETEQLPTGNETVFDVSNVDSIAIRDPSSAAPVYPAPLFEKGVQGSTLVEYVVDTTGTVDTETFRVVVATHPLFSVAVRDALPLMKFKPASILGHPVRQLVQQEFRFQIDTAALAKAAAPPRKKSAKTAM